MDSPQPETGLAGQYNSGFRAALDSPTQQLPLVPSATYGITDFHRHRPSADVLVDAILPGLPDESTIRPHAPAPTLKPFYTVVSDITPSSSSSDTYYPCVRYVFSDDDPDIISAVLSPDLVPRSNPGHGRSSLAPRTGTVRHGRSILLDLAPNADGRGYAVAWASSVSPDWAVVGTRLQPLEPVSASEVIDDEGGCAMVLEIEGLSLPTTTSCGDPQEYRRTSLLQDGRKASSVRTGKATPKPKDYDDLVRAFESRMALLRSAVRNSEERRRLISVSEPKQAEKL